MKYLLSTALAICMLGAFAQVDRSKLPVPSAPRPIKIGDYKSFELKNGLRVFVIENHKLPRVSYNLIFDSDPVMEGDKAGYLSMVGQMMRRGTETRTKEQIDEEVDFIGASLVTDSKSVFATSLSKYNEKILEIMTDVIFNPTFPEEELEKIRQQTLSSLAASKDDQGYIASNLGAVLVYGKDHPYGEIQTEETTKNITVEDLRAYHKKYFRPNIAYLAIVGDVDIRQIEKTVKTYFGGWQKGDVEKSHYETPRVPEKNIVAVVNRPNAVQSNLNITHPVDLKVGSEDEIKALVMNQILGGSFTSKLFTNLREDKGYTYGSYSSLSADELVGRFDANAEVRNQVTDSAIVQMMYEMEQMKNGNISEIELDIAKNSITGNFSMSLEQPQTVANFALDIAIYNLPQDYYATYLQKVQAVTKEDVQEMAKKYLRTENAYITVVGKASEIADKLGQFGEVKYFNAYGDEVDPSLTKLPEGLTAEKILYDYQIALGGKEAIDAIENVSMKIEAEIPGMPQKLSGKQVLAKGMKSRLELSMSGMVVASNVSDGKDAAVMQMGNKAPLDEASKEEQIISNGLFSELNLLQAGASTKLASVEKINNKDAYGIEVTLSKGNTYTVFFDSETGLKLRQAKVLKTPQGQLIQMTDYLNYQEVGGVKFPFTLVQSIGPQKIEMNVTDISVNESLPEDTFRVE